MTLYRIRKSRGWGSRRRGPTQAPSESVSAARRVAARATARSVKRAPEDEISPAESEVRDCEDRIAPAADRLYQLCKSVTIDLYLGRATQKQIQAALKAPSDPGIASYSRKYQDDLRLVCRNHGIDPRHGRAYDLAVGA